MSREQGVVKWFNAAKGFGFIQRSRERTSSSISPSIQMDGYKVIDRRPVTVEFEVKQGPKGLSGRERHGRLDGFDRRAVWLASVQ